MDFRIKMFLWMFTSRIIWHTWLLTLWVFEMQASFLLAYLKTWKLENINNHELCSWYPVSASLLHYYLHSLVILHISWLLIRRVTLGAKGAKMCTQAPHLKDDWTRLLRLGYPRGRTLPLGGFLVWYSNVKDRIPVHDPQMTGAVLPLGGTTILPSN